MPDSYHYFSNNIMELCIHKKLQIFTFFQSQWSKFGAKNLSIFEKISFHIPLIYATSGCTFSPWRYAAILFLQPVVRVFPSTTHQLKIRAQTERSSSAVQRCCCQARREGRRPSIAHKEVGIENARAFCITASFGRNRRPAVFSRAACACGGQRSGSGGDCDEGADL